MKYKRYQVFGLVLASEVDLPELEADTSTALAAVTIQRGAFPRPHNEPIGLSQAPAGVILNVQGVGRYLIRDGNSITVQADAHSSERNVRLYLLGSGLGAILHQRAMLPLHANAIEIDGRAVAFMGHSGAGKSTMAAWFHDRGFRALSDDVCVVSSQSEGRALAFPGIPRLRLWQDALEATGRANDTYDRSFDSDDKFDVPTHDAGVSRDPLELSHVYLLKRGDANKSATIKQLQGIEALDALVANTYRGGYLKLIGGTQRHLQQCLLLLKAAPVFEAERVWGYTQFDSEAQALLQHARRVIARQT